jgi:hypothetical protein
MEKIRKFLPAPLILLAFLVSFIIIYIVAPPILQDNDMGWHIAAGDLIRSLDNLPHHDTWSFSGSEQQWYNHSWLWDIILSLVHEKFGVEGLFIFAASCPALLVALLLKSLGSRPEIGINALIAIGFITIYCLLEFATGRPQLIGLFFALAFNHILSKTRLDNNCRCLYLLPFIMLLWVNIHASFIAGLFIIGAYGLEAIYFKNKSWLIKLFIVGIVCLLSVLINPYGISLVTFIISVKNSVITKYINEWNPFVFGNVIGASIWFAAFIIFSNLRGKNTFLADKILVVSWLFAMMISVRNMGLLAILGAPYLAGCLPPDNKDDINTHKLAAWLNNKNSSPKIMAAIFAIMTIGYFMLPVLGEEHYMERREKAVLPAISYLIKNYQGKRVFNDYDMGGRIIYESKGEFPVFVDGRAGSVYEEKILQDFISIYSLEDGWEKILDSYKINMIILRNDRPFALNYTKGYYHDKWDEVFHDDVASIYVRKN